MAVVTICSDSGAQKEKICHYFHFSPFYLLWSDGTACHNLLVFWMLSLKLYLSCCSLTFIKRFFISSLLSATKVESSPYLRLLIFLLEILIPACDSTSLAFHLMYSAYNLNKQGDNIQPCCIPFALVSCFPSSSNCCFSICIQVSQETGKVVWYFHLFKNFPLLWSKQSKGLV